MTDVQIKNQLTENVTFPDDSIMAEDKMSQHFVSQARGAVIPNRLRWRLAPIITIILVSPSS